jgi:hypothetical protein
MPRFLKSSHFWGGFIAGMVVGPWALGKVLPGVKAKLPTG